MDGLKIFAAEVTVENGFGRECGIAIARNIDEAYQMFVESDECEYVNYDDIIEIPMELGYTYIGGYTE